MLFRDARNLWRKDFGVTLIHLPWETCIGLVACINQYTSKMAPQITLEQEAIPGFVVSENYMHIKVYAYNILCFKTTKTCTRIFSVELYRRYDYLKSEFKKNINQLYVYYYYKDMQNN